MRIAIDARPLHKPMTGIGRYTLEIMRHLIEIDRTNEYLILSDVDIPLPPGNWKRWSPGPAIAPIWYFKAWQYLKDHADVCLTSTPYLPNLWPGRCVFTVHDMSVTLFPKTHTISNRILNLLVPRAIAQARRIIAVSQHTKRDILKLLPKTPASKIEVIYNAVDDRFSPVPLETATEKIQALNLRLPYILCLGTLEPRKNLIRLLDAYQTLQAGRTPALVFVGQNGWLKQDLREEVKTRGLSDRVRTLGFVSDDLLPSLYSAATAFVYPSLYEGFGIPVLEAMACGAPVITSNVSSLPELTGDKGAILVNPLQTRDIANGISQVLKDEALSQRLREAGFARSRDFSWKRSAEQTLRLLS